MILIVGLGNPGMKYKNTYHNIGFMVVDEIAKKTKSKFNKKVCKAKVCECSYLGVDFVLAKPETFMNLSGESVKQLIKKYGVDDSSELFIVYDDVDLPVGRMRIRTQGSAGTHNGMRSIVSTLNTTQFMRLRVGIKNEDLKEKRVELVEFVLSKLDYQDKLVLNKCIEDSSSALLSFVDGESLERIEARINKKN